MNKIKFFAKLFSFLLTFIISTSLFSCDGFFQVLTPAKQEQFKAAASASLSTELKCQCPPAYVMTTDSKPVQLCIPCTLTILSIQSMVDLFPEEQTQTIASEHKVEIDDVMIYHPDCFQQPVILNALNEEIKKSLESFKAIKPLVEHKGIASCPSFDQDAPFTSVGEDKVPTQCFNCYERMVLAQTGTTLPYLMLIPSSQASKAGSALGMNLNNVHRIALNQGTQDHAKNLLSTIPENRTVNCLLIFGDHGLTGTLFGKGPKAWREAVIEPLRQKNFKARTIILDACFSASMIPVFTDLLTKDGIIVGGASYVTNLPLTKEIINLIASNKMHEIESVVSIITDIKQQEAYITQAELPIILAHSPFGLLKKMTQLANLASPESLSKLFELVQKIDQEETIHNKQKLYAALQERGDEKITLNKTQALLQEWKKIDEETFTKKSGFFFAQFFARIADELIETGKIQLPSMYGVYAHRDRTFRYDQAYEFYDQLLIDTHQGTPFTPVHDLWGVIKSFLSQDDTIKLGIV